MAFRKARTHDNAANRGARLTRSSLFLLSPEVRDFMQSMFLLLAPLVIPVVRDYSLHICQGGTAVGS